MKVTLAIGHTLGDVSCWCEIEHEHDDGRIEFLVINGGWRGVLYANGTMSIAGDTELMPAFEVWRGEVHSDFRHHYNDAIPWIRRQINAAL